jgi:hypothetical protein
MSTTSNNYFLNIDTYYRDVGKYPNPCDFGISFNRFDGTGTFVQGDPINSTSFFEQVSIDPDYKDNNLQFVNATLNQINRTTTSLTISGLYDFTKNFSINYLNTNLYTHTGYVYPMTSPYPNSIYYITMILPFICQLSYDENADIPYQILWNTYIKPSSVPVIYYNVSTKSTFQISSKGDFYWLFDFSLRSFDFIIYRNGVDNYLTTANNPTIDPRTSADKNGNFGYICACLALINNNGDIGIVNKHAYGYHIFSNTFNISGTQLNGQNSLLVDQSDNTLVSLNIDPYTFVIEKSDFNTYSRSDFGSTSWVGYLSDEDGNPSYFFQNSSGTVAVFNNQVAFSPNLVNFGSGPYELFFLQDDPTQPYLSFKVISPETGSANTLWVNSSIFFTGTNSNELFYWNSNVPNLNVSLSTNTKIFTINKNSFTSTLIQTIPTTGAASCAFCKLGGVTYLFSQNISNYLDVYTFDVTTYIVTRITGIQIPDSYIFTRNLFTTKIGTDIYIWSIPKTSGNSPASFWILSEGVVFVTKFDTILNVCTVINTFNMARDTGYNALILSFRPNNTYLYSVSYPTNKIVCFDITNPYNIVKKQSIDANSVNNIFTCTQTINGSKKYYIIINQIGGGQNRAIYDITDVDKPILLGKNIKSIGVPPGELLGVYNNYFYGRVQEGFAGAASNINFFKRERSPFIEQTMRSTQYNQNIGLTSTSPTGAVRCTTFNLNDRVYTALISSTALSIYDITAIRSTKLISSISVSFPPTIYDIQTINFNNNQYFVVCSLGAVISFILSSNLLSITYTGIFSAIPDAFSESKLFIFNNIPIAIIGSYTSRVYRFILYPTLTLTSPPLLTIAGKLPSLVMCWYESSFNKQYIIVSTTNFLTSNDTYFYFDVGTSLTLIGSQLVTAPGAMPRSGTTIISPVDSTVYGAGYANVGWGILTPNQTNVLLSGFIFVNVQAMNIPTNLNGMCRFFYTDKLYCIVNQYGGPGSFGDYITCFDLTQPDYGIQIFDNNIASVGTGASTGSPISNIDIQIAQKGDQTTLVVLNSNGTFYLYDISNPDFAGRSQTVFLTSDIKINPSNFGSSYIYKLTNEGYPVYNNSLRNFNQGTGINGTLINTSNIKISSDNLSIYVSGGFTDQIQLYNPNTGSPSNQLTTFGLNYNGFIAKFDAITGQWLWIIPLYGSNDDFINKIQYISNLNKIVICGYTSSEDLLIYQKQTSGNLINPIIFQSNIAGSVSSTNSFVVCIDSNGVVSWYTNTFSDESSSNVNFLDIGTQGNQIIVTGFTNSSIVQTIDSTFQPVQNLYSQVSNLGQKSLIAYTFNTSGVYQKSQFILLPNLTLGLPTDIKLFSELNLSSFCFYLDYQSLTNTEYYNKDGTLAHTDTGPSNTIVSYVVDYFIDSQYTDTNGSKYSSIKLQNIPTYPFTGGFMSNYNMYILGYANSTTLNKNFSIRDNFIASTGDYRIILNSSINTSTIDRNLFIVNNITGSNDFYNINISSSPLSSIFEYNIGDMPTINNTITTSNLSNLDTSLQYYITIPKYNQIYSYPVLNISTDVNGDYVFQLDNVNDLRISTGGSFYGPYLYLTQFNQNIFYNLQFFPASLNLPVFYTIQLNSLVLPNRPLRQSPNNFVRNLTDMPYIYIAIYSVDEFDIPDDEIVNIVYDNNPNRERIEIFQLNTINAGDTSNFVTYTTSVRPRVKFNSSFTTLRIKLFDRYGNILLFDNTPYKTSDSRFTNSVVPDQLMNISIQFLLTKI